MTEYTYTFYYDCDGFYTKIALNTKGFLKEEKINEIAEAAKGDIARMLDIEVDDVVQCSREEYEDNVEEEDPE